MSIVTWFGTSCPQSTIVMVRVKNRYLLVHILYPDAADGPNARFPISKSNGSVPDVVQFHQPTPDSLTPQLLARAIRDEISLLFGDYGVGITAGSLSGTVPLQSSLERVSHAQPEYADIALQSNISRRRHRQPSSDARGLTTVSYGPHCPFSLNCLKCPTSIETKHVFFRW